MKRGREEEDRKVGKTGKWNETGRNEEWEKKRQESWKMRKIERNRRR